MIDNLIDCIPSYPDYTTEDDLWKDTNEWLDSHQFNRLLDQMFASSDVETRRLIDHLEDTGEICDNEGWPDNWWKQAIYKN